uniref:Uncharacterized protein n=1 Tax=Leersia perrieri TaxID=77586 RepID=A0A0D9W057_9ORYZ
MKKMISANCSHVYASLLPEHTLIIEMAFTMKAPSPSPVSSSSAHTTRHAATPAPARAAFRKSTAALTLDRAPAPAAERRRRRPSVSQTMSRLKENGKKAFIPYITAGDPDMETTAEALRLLDACGADVIELGVPFSDPYADGAAIQASAARALAAGATMDGVMAMLKDVTPELSCPVVLFSYFNPIVRRGPAEFTAAAKEAGVQGLIVPDLPYVETCTFRSEAIKNSLELVLLTTPATPADRMKTITAASGGFVYLVSVDGVTGPRQKMNPRVEHLLQEIKQVTDKSVCVGFGISTPDHVRQIAEWGADGVIIGSAMVRQLGEAASPKQGLKRLEALSIHGSLLFLTDSDSSANSTAAASISRVFRRRSPPLQFSGSPAPPRTVGYWLLRALPLLIRGAGAGARRGSAGVSRPRGGWSGALMEEVSGGGVSVGAGGKRGVAETFSRLREQGKTAFIPFITAGDPDLATTSKALKILDSCGSDVIELGVPYSDPLADGPVIQAAATRALKNGTTFYSVIAMLKEIIPELSCPIVLFTYYNPILKHGVRNFMEIIKQAGVRGLVVPDLPLEEATLLRNEAITHNIELVLLTTPTTPTERMEEIAKASEGFIYLVSSVGVTGTRSNVNLRVEHLLQEIKKVTDKPVAVGFGVSTPEHVKQIAGWGADGVIIGSAIVRQLGEAASPGEGLKRLEEYTKNMKAAMA